MYIDADRMLVGDAPVHGGRAQWDDSINPAAEETIGRAPAATAADVERGVTAAEIAWPKGAALTVDQRGNVLRELAKRLLERSDDLLKIQVADTGNTVTPMRGDVKTAARKESDDCVS